MDNINAPIKQQTEPKKSLMSRKGKQAPELCNANKGNNKNDYIFPSGSRNAVSTMYHKMFSLGLSCTAIILFIPSDYLASSSGNKCL